MAAVTRKKVQKRGGMNLTLRWNQYIRDTLDASEHEYLGEETHSETANYVVFGS